MLKSTYPVSAINFVHGTIQMPIKFQFSFDKTKQWLSNKFKEHDAKVQKDKKDHPNIADRTVQNFPQSFIDTAYRLVHILISEYQKGKTKGKFTVRCTWSFIKGALIGSKLTERSLQRHLDRLLNNLTFDFIKEKTRSTLGERGIASSDNNTNCIAIEFSPSCVRSVDNSQNELLDNGFDFENSTETVKNTQIIFGENETKTENVSNTQISGGGMEEYFKNFLEMYPIDAKKDLKSPSLKGDNDILTDKCSD
jgi:hypothetical protein